MVEMEQKYSLAAAAAGQVGENTFVSRLLKTVAELFDKELYSDITVTFDGKKVKSHKFILAARSGHWSSRDLNEISELELTGVDGDVGIVMMRWVYTDNAEIPYDENFLIRLVKVANKYKLKALRERCEKMLMSSVSVANCIKYYQTAEDIGAKDLQKYCAEIISNHWHDLKTEDFTHMSAPLLYEMFKSKSAYPLHLAIRHHREDVVFLFVIEFNSQLPGKLNELEPSTGQVPLFIALVEQQESIARTLVGHGCDVIMADIDGQTLLHKAIKDGDEFAALFLIRNGAQVSAATHSEHETPLHLAASYRPWSAANTNNAVTRAQKMTSAEGMARIVSLMIDNGANADSQDSQGRTPLHRAIEAKNEPVMSMLLEKARLNLELRDNEGRVPLWLALSCDGKIDPLDEESLAAKLVRSGASPDAVSSITGDSLLHMAASSGNEEAGLFLAPRGTDPNHNNKMGETPLHEAARKGLAKFAAALLNNGANPNAQTMETEQSKISADERLQARIQAKLEARNRAVKKIIDMRQHRIQKRAAEVAEKRKRRPQPKPIPPSEINVPMKPQTATPGNPFEEDLGSFDTGDADNPFLEDIRAAASAAAAFTRTNPFDDSETFNSARTSNARVLEVDKDEEEEYQEETGEPLEEEINNVMEDYQLYKDPYCNTVITECFGKTPLHIAIAEKHENVVNCIIEFQDSVGRGGRIQIVPDFNLVDSEDQTVLELALWTGQYQVAERLLEAGASINGHVGKGFSLLHKAIKRGDNNSALFLLDHGADINMKTATKQSPLQLAIQCRLQPAVEALCTKGADLNSCDESGMCPLWAALKSEQHDIASTLVKYGCDTDAWSLGPNGCTQSLLHRGIAERDETASCFLIRSCCDINSPRRPGPGGDGGVEAWDGMTPLHLACAAGLDNVVQCLVEHKANVNSKDSEGRCPAHIAIAHKHPIVIQLLLSHPDLIMNTADRSGQTLFAAALAARINEAASTILAREPGAAEQFDNKGRNYLHSAILSKDVDTVLFLVGVSADVNSPIQDSTLRTPLHLAVSIGSEIVVRHLLLAGASVNDVDTHKQTALHMAAAHDQPKLMSIMLEHCVNADAVDEKFNNALHVAVQCGHVNCVRVLLTESSINAEAINARGQNPLHVLAQYAKDNAVAIFELFRQSMPDYPMNSLDSDENTALFLAYTNGAARLCREILRAGGSLATINKYGTSIFNAQVPTRKLLFTLLDMLNTEPPWSDGLTCHECTVKFTVKTRKHHCRHCGRLLCSKCSAKQIPIIKYELTKPVRVCDVCFDMLTS